MNKTLPSVGEGCDLPDLQNIQLDYLSEYKIFMENHIARFGENLIERAPEYELTKQKTACFS